MIQYRREGHQHCVYVHKRRTNGVPFYVGISGNKIRPYEFESRTQLWKNVANKHGVEVVIVADGLTLMEAVTIESEMIKAIGRICDKSGPLCNFKVHHFERHKTDSKPTQIGTKIDTNPRRKRRMNRKSTGIERELDKSVDRIMSNRDATSKARLLRRLSKRGK